MGRVYYIRRRRQQYVWPVVSFLVIVGLLAEVSKVLATGVAVGILALWAWSAIFAAVERNARGGDDGG